MRDKIIHDHKYPGFTMLEILVVIGILIFAFAIVFPLTISQIRIDKLSSSAEQFAGVVFEAQQYAYARKAGKGYGVMFEGSKYWIVSGDSPDTSSNDDDFAFESGLVAQGHGFAGGPQIFFPAGDVRPIQPGSVFLDDGGRSIEIRINSEGAISIHE